MKQNMVWLSGLAVAAAVGMVACSGPAKPSTDLSRDLDAAASPSALTLAPTSGRRDVVSAVERAPDARRAVAPAQKQASPSSAVAHEPAAQAVAATPQPVIPAQPTQVASAPAAAVPTPATSQAGPSRRPVPIQQAHGRYKTEAEVFRNAPFPITP